MCHFSVSHEMDTTIISMCVPLAMLLAVYLSSHDVDKVWCQHKWCPLSLEALHGEQQHHCEIFTVTVTRHPSRSFVSFPDLENVTCLQYGNVTERVLASYNRPQGPTM